MLGHACLKCLNQLVASTDTYQHTKNELHASTHFLFFHFWKCLVMLDHAHLMCLNQLLTLTYIHPHKIITFIRQLILDIFDIQKLWNLIGQEHTQACYLKCLNHVKVSKPEGCDSLFCTKNLEILVQTERF